MDVFDCIRCKGRFCGGGAACPLRAKIHTQDRLCIDAKQEFCADVPSLFVGRSGYPNVDVGFLATMHDRHHDDPSVWVREEYGISDIINLRASLINSSFRADVRGLRNRWLEMGQLIAMAAKPAQVEISLSKKPSFYISPSHDVTPHGPTIRIRKAILASNPKIPAKVEKIVDDTDLKAADGLFALAHKGFDEHYLTGLLSSGNLGITMQRKLVPTRWSITAVDDALGKRLIEQVKRVGRQTDHMVFFGSYLGNYFLVMMFPDAWQYELFETYVGSSRKSTFATDHESYAGRKGYAKNTAGGYYAARLAVLEGLCAQRRHGSCLVLRFITDEYWTPLGVWVVREASRSSMRSTPTTFVSQELMLQYVCGFVKKKFGCDINGIIKASRILMGLRGQKKLNQFL